MIAPQETSRLAALGHYLADNETPKYRSLYLEKMVAELVAIERQKKMAVVMMMFKKTAGDKPKEKLVMSLADVVDFMSLDQVVATALKIHNIPDDRPQTVTEAELQSRISSRWPWFDLLDPINCKPPEYAEDPTPKA